MKNSPHSFLSLAASALLVLAATATAAPHSYQVTGPVLAVTDTSITVQKGAEKWELQRDANTNVTGDLKVGSKVTIEYFMTATSAEVRADAKADKKAAK